MRSDGFDNWSLRDALESPDHDSYFECLYLELTIIIGNNESWEILSPKSCMGWHALLSTLYLPPLPCLAFALPACTPSAFLALRSEASMKHPGLASWPVHSVPWDYAGSSLMPFCLWTTLWTCLFSSWKCPRSLSSGIFCDLPQQGLPAFHCFSQPEARSCLAWPASTRHCNCSPAAPTAYDSLGTLRSSPRYKRPNADRPFKVPGGWAGAITCAGMPMLCMLFMMATMWRTVLVCAAGSLTAFFPWFLCSEVYFLCGQ